MLKTFLVNTGFSVKQFDEVIYANSDDSNIDAFIFPFGCITIWYNDSNKQDLDKEIIAYLKDFQQDSIDDVVYDFIHFEYGEESDEQNPNNSFIDEERNKIILGDKSEYVKLSISHALAQSVKLNVLEKSVSNLLATTAPIQQELALTGSVSLSKKELSKKIGNLFSERYLINLHSDILDTPEFFWRRPSYEPIYLMTAAFQDISVRQSILNHRLDVIQELYNILSNELNYKNSARLEVTIVILITIEVILALSHNNIITNFFGF